MRLATRATRLVVACTLASVIATRPGSAEKPARAAYKSPYSVAFTFSDEDLFGDLLTGPRANWKEQSTVPFRDWDNSDFQARWKYRGPPAKRYAPPAGMSKKSPEWLRQRVIATGLRYVGYSYQHHHIPDWDPPANWVRDETQKTPPGKGLDCSNFTAFVYNQGLGIKPSSDVQDQSEMLSVAGPGLGNTSPVKRLELPPTYEDFAQTLLTGDLLYVKNRSGDLSHVVLWVGKIGQSPDGAPLILDSTGSGNYDINRTEIPDGIYLRPFTERSWYFKQASHILRIIPDHP